MDFFSGTIRENAFDFITKKTILRLRLKLWACIVHRNVIKFDDNFMWVTFFGSIKYCSLLFNWNTNTVNERKNRAQCLSFCFCFFFKANEWLQDICQEIMKFIFQIGHRLCTFWTIVSKQWFRRASYDDNTEQIETNRRNTGKRKQLKRILSMGRLYEI